MIYEPTVLAFHATRTDLGVDDFTVLTGIHSLAVGRRDSVHVHLQLQIWRGNLLGFSWKFATFISQSESRWSDSFLTPASNAQSLLNEIVVLCLRVERQADWPDEVCIRGSELQSQEGNIVVLIGSVRVVLFMWNLLFDRNVDGWVGIAHNFIN